MTEQEAKNKLVSWAKAQIGYREGESNWNKYAQGKESAYGWNVQNQPWCDVFVDAGFIECFGLDTARKMTYQPVFSALCSASAQNYKNNNAWYNSPEVGDQAFFNYEGGINHTGIVINVSGGLVYTVEGNSSDMVRMGVYATGHSAIAGYGRPNWSVVTGENENASAPSADHKTVKTVSELPTLKRGDKGEIVRSAQFLLNGREASCGMWGADGDFGPATLGATRAFQRRNGLEPDGIIGPATWAALLGVE